MLDNSTFFSVQYASQSNSEHLFDVAVFVDVLQKCKWIGKRGLRCLAATWKSSLWTTCT